MKKKIKNFLKKFNSRFLKVAYFSFLVFVLEVVLFHAFNYIHDYFDAILIISYVILGIGLGAFFSSKLRIREENLFVLCSLGILVSLYFVTFKILFFASPGISNLLFLFVFFFPAVYISRIYTEQKTNKAYLFDMMGGFFAIISVVLLYYFFISETIFLFVLFVVPFVSLLVVLLEKVKFKIIMIFIFLGLLIPGILLFYNQTTKDRYNLFNTINCEKIERSPEGTTKIFCRDVERIKTYDNLVGRIDVVKYRHKDSFLVCYDGWPNDLFHKRWIISQSDDYERNKKKKWPTLDVRFLYGVVRPPKILVVGSSAQGLIKPLKLITPYEKIKTTEINPAIIEIMRKDFTEESGYAYLGIDPIQGNAISFLKSSEEEFDMITLMNTHSVRNLSHRGAPDYLHTKETYNLLFNHLTDFGYLMFEERPEEENGKLALYRMINTLYHTLKERGVKDPTEHFVIWSWDNSSSGYKKYSLNYFVGIMITKNPVREELVLPWVEAVSQRKSNFFHLEYFKGQEKKLSSSEFIELFKMIEKNDFANLEEEHFDPSIVTNNRPFLSQARTEDKKLNKLIKQIGIFSFLLWAGFTTSLVKSKKKKESMILNLYNILIGFGFFLIEIIIFQVYQNIFLSPSFSFVFALGFLVLFSGIGGYFSTKIPFKKISRYAVFLLIFFSLIAIYLPGWLFGLKISSLLIKSVGLVLISITGFLMGFYFPLGLNLAKKLGLKKKIYHFFAINATAGGFAATFSLYLGIKIGYVYTIFIGLIFYLFASLILILSSYKLYES